MYTPFPAIKNDSLALAVNRELGFEHVSPIVYQGGKYRHVRYITSLMPAKMKYMFEPFMGGLSTTISLIKAGRVNPENCFASDISKPLVNFFKVLQSDFESLTLKLAEDSAIHSGGSRHLFKEAIDILQSSKDEYELARAFYIFNKTSMPHVWDFVYKAFAPSKIAQNAGISLPQILRLPLYAALVMPMQFRVRDYTKSLTIAAKKGKQAFVFLDPPYENHESLYGIKSEFDFDLFSERCHAVAGKCTFMITINDSPANRERFKRYNVIERTQYYGGSHNPDGHELVICNYELDKQDYYLNRLGYRVAA